MNAVVRDILLQQSAAMAVVCVAVNNSVDRLRER